MTLKIIFIFFEFLIVIIPVLISVAYLTLLERKVLGYSQSRKGPNVVGFYGILQPLADGVKLFSKEVILPSHANIFLFSAAPILALTFGLFPWFLFPWGSYIGGSCLNHPYSLLLVLAIMSLSIFGVLLSGWSSNSKYAFLGSIRAVAQMISYEVSLTLILMNIILCSASCNLVSISTSQSILGSFFLLIWPLALIYFISMLAETNRAPFDLSEGESELVSGYNVEYSSMSFALFFLAEYSHIIFSSFLFIILFWNNNFCLFLYNLKKWSFLLILFMSINCFKGTFIAFVFIWVRTSFPRLRYDQVMSLCWKKILPLSIATLWFINSIVWSLNLVL